MAAQRQLVLTTVGISLFLNALNTEEREEGGIQRLNQQANATELPADMDVFLDELAARSAQTLAEAAVLQNRRLSAEMNGLYGLYDDQLRNAGADVHVLIATDTVLGSRAAQLLESFLRSQNIANVTQVATYRRKIGKMEEAKTKSIVLSSKPSAVTA